MAGCRGRPPRGRGSERSSQDERPSASESRGGSRTGVHGNHIGIAYLEGRGFHGVRRALTDTADDESSDDRVLNALTGHRDSSTRRQLYMDMEREEDRAEAAVVRRRMRKRIVGDGVGDEDGNQTALTPDLTSITADLQHLDATELAGITALIEAAARTRQ